MSPHQHTVSVSGGSKMELSVAVVHVRPADVAEVARSRISLLTYLLRVVQPWGYRYHVTSHSVHNMQDAMHVACQVARIEAILSSGQGTLAALG